MRKPRTTVEGWHFLRADGCLNFPPHTKVEVGQTLRLPDGTQPKLCEVGFHASERAAQALGYAPAGAELWICRVTLGGCVLRDTDKLVASERTVRWMAPARPTLVAWACWCATGALLGEVTRGRRIDPRSWVAVETVERFLRGEAARDEVSAARDAARDAAWDAAGDAAMDAAWAAAWTAAWAAAWTAAWAAARAAAGAAAWAAAGDAARDAMDDELERRFLLLAPPGAA